MKVTRTKNRNKSNNKVPKQTNYLDKKLRRFERTKPSDKRIAKMNKRQRKQWCVGEFTEYGCSITFEMTNGMPADWETNGVNTVLDILDSYKVDTILGWDADWYQLKQYTINLYNYPNSHDRLGYDFVQLIANHINEKVFKGMVGEIRMNFDALWED